MFSESRLITPYFQQMTLRSKILKIIHNTPFFGTEWISLGLSIILIILGAEGFS